MTRSIFRSIALLSAVLGSVAADGFQDMKLHSSCSAYTGIIGDIFDEIVNQATEVHSAMTMVVANNPALSQPDRTVVLNTFDAFFGVNNGGDARGNDLISVLNVMMGLENNQPHLTIYCGDDSSYYTKTDKEDGGDTIVEEPGFQYIFNDPDTPNLPPQRMALGFLRCNDAAANGGLQLAYVSGGTRMFLCPSTVSLANTSPNRHAPLADGTVFDDQRTKATVIFHELLHVLIPGMVGDQSGGVADGGERYNFRDIHSIAGQDVSVRNPDSVAMYCLALWLGGNDWSSGVARPYPQALQQQP